MRRAAVVALLLLAATGAPTAAEADYFVPASADPGRVVRTLDARTRISGELTVTFAADPATCAAAGRCGESGTQLWRAGLGGTLRLREIARRTGRTVEPSLSLFDDAPSTLVQTRRGERRCSDADDGGGQLTAELVGGDLVLGVPRFGPGPIETRCGGPVWEDIRDVLPRRPVPLATVRRSGAVVDLRASRTFVAGGLTGTVESTLIVRLGRPRPPEEDTDEDEEREERDELPFRVRDWRIERVGGGMTDTVRGVGSEALCAPLDACGIGGTLTYTPVPEDGFLRVVSDAREVFGSGAWLDAGSLMAKIGRGDGSDPCADTTSLGAGSLTVVGPRPDGGVVIGYAPVGAQSRCPGPVRGADILDYVVYGVVPRGTLDRGRPFTVRLDRGADRVVGGFRVSTTSDLVLRLTPIRR